MTRLMSVRRVALLLWFCLGWSGCSFFGQSAWDEEKDPNYLTGRSRLASLNYPGAILAFERALEANPRSAAAHLELGLIYYQYVTTNWARAIYHFEKYLELRPKANNADLIRQNMEYCKLALAKEVPFTLNNDRVRKELERLTRENSDLRQQLEQLKTQLALRPAPVSNSAPATKLAALTQASSNPGVEPAPTANRSAATSTARDSARPAAAAKTHVIQAGETPYAIARYYGVKPASLLSANPGLDPKRLRPGQTLIIPVP